MYAVIRTGGKQYCVSPGELVKIEKASADTDNNVEFTDVLAFSDGTSPIVSPTDAKVFGTVVTEGRADKILVFHYKRKKQYKKLQGHRQSFTEVRIKSILVDGVALGAAV
jgi:large subunit ribosomal protein L21